ncbi:MAG: HAMP domain-containing sensor histidine kinase, partial [Planctomycetota bacterium]|nr:HAMP domain-containing sensor histidine kinase [Planctomycetota bacterium]
AVTWLATLAALIAITYGTFRYVTIIERRMRFVAAVTHELRTPLTTFQLYTDLLSGDAAKDPERRREYIETLRGESKRLARLVENVLAYSRMGARAPKLDRRRIMPAELLEAVRSETAGRCDAANKQLVIDNRCRHDVAVDTDSEFVVQILSNLVDNACKYSSGAEDRRIWLSTSDGPDNSVVFEVEDAGPGVAQADRREIFRPFRRGRTADAEGLSGMGLGLALSRYWAECLGGRLTLGHGRQNGVHLARFELSLPCESVG